MCCECRVSPPEESEDRLPVRNRAGSEKEERFRKARVSNALFKFVLAAADTVFGGARSDS